MSHNLKRVSLGILISFLCLSFFNVALAAKPETSIPRVENSNEQELNISKSDLPALLKKLQITPQTSSVPVQQRIAPAPSALAPATPTLSNNLISNPDLDLPVAGNTPADWFRGGYGQNTRSLTYPVPGVSGQGIQVTISQYTSGDAKWYFKDVPVTAGNQYQFSDYYQSTVPSTLTARYLMSDGSYTYQDLATLNPASSFQQATAQFVAPANAVSITIFHLINSVGVITTDSYSLNIITQPNPQPGNLVTNPDFEQASGSLPTGWGRGRWGNNTALFTYPDAGVSGRGAGVAISQYSSGDAKWYFNPVNVTPGDVMTYSDQYNSNIPSIITAQFQLSNGSFTYQDLATLPSSSGNWSNSQAQLAIPAGAVNVTVFHLINQVGNLKIDNVSLSKGGATQGLFSTGGVTLSLDDGSLSQYQNAVPKLESAGLKATFYVATEQLADNGFPGYMSRAQVEELNGKGFEIGAHTQHHVHLPQLSYSQQFAEVDGSKQDLIAMGITPQTFAYPFGEFDANSVQIVRQDFQSARTTITGYVTPSDDKALLARQSVEVNVPFSNVKGWIDTAIANKEWLILAIHQVDNSGVQYSTSPSTFNQIVDYLVAQHVPVVTVSQGVSQMNP